MHLPSTTMHFFPKNPPRLEGLKFSAAHFVAFDGFREPLHGHNYTVAAQIGAQSLQQDGYVVDFGDVKKILRQICRRLGSPKASETSERVEIKKCTFSIFSMHYFSVSI